jgi:hypothetical protein
MIKIFGHSDDCFEVEGDFRGENEYNPRMDKPLVLEIRDWTMDKDVIVTGRYGGVGVWSIAVEPIDEDKPMPPMHIELAPNGYSPLLVIECTDNTVVREITPEARHD